METLIEQIENTSLKQFGETVKSEIHELLLQEPNKLKAYIALLLFGKEIVQALDNLPVEGLISQVKKEMEELSVKIQGIDASCQAHLSENEEIVQMIAGRGPVAEFDHLQKQLKDLLRLQDDFLRQIVVQQEKKSFETIASQSVATPQP